MPTGHIFIMHSRILHETPFVLFSVLFQAIPGEGVLIIGQEQDEVGRNFSASEAFDGSISQFNVWDKVLSESEISSQSSYRCNHIRGNLLAWTDFYNKASDNVKKVTVLCAGISKNICFLLVVFFKTGKGAYFSSFFFTFKDIYHKSLNGRSQSTAYTTYAGYPIAWLVVVILIRIHYYIHNY